MRNIKILVEYEGTRYAGWQVQPHEPTVQGTILEAVKRLTEEDVDLIGASRTDSGVHAFGQVANFKLRESTIPVSGIMHGLNSLLPDDIVVKAAEEAPPEFDARRNARSKTYLYRILNRTFPSAIFRRYSWFVRHSLDVELMREGGRLFLGKKDFSSFRAAGSDAPHSVREILSVDIERKEDGFIDIEIRGTAFLRHMVRIMVGTLVTLGMGKIGLRDLEEILEARKRTAAPMTAPSKGLFLKEVEYPRIFGTDTVRR